MVYKRFDHVWAPANVLEVDDSVPGTAVRVHLAAATGGWVEARDLRPRFAVTGEEVGYKEFYERVQVPFQERVWAYLKEHGTFTKRLGLFTSDAILAELADRDLEVATLREAYEALIKSASQSFTLDDPEAGWFVPAPAMNTLRAVLSRKS